MSSRRLSFSRARSSSNASTQFGVRSESSHGSEAMEVVGSLQGHNKRWNGIGSTGITEEEERDVNDLDYDPAQDPDHRLRITRTATDSIHESMREEDRRRAWRIRRSGLASTSMKKLGKSRSIFGRRKTKKGHDGAVTDPGEEAPPPVPAHIDDIVPGGLPDVERMRTRMDKEQAENKDRMERMDIIIRVRQVF
ncbi:hypothetical protein BT69DRAFT_1337695 [Atractiella rhizophila]|nr:hypothetical protein BT69DRAFT_1337695 [Atractiella rhizophila]